ncbi:VTC domain-containing protein [Nocardioides mesophilus]|uniref:VTC domain-containing protein n=1 Tax=Nocardioides mesophilus TaxID=433659 RepID=A0A7G9R798_9ACTN|nr:VTC domain-containing protein [Nocardioides mesophilus]QNN51473.1 VTC domain-containing protein [Nocardioides mesophilus]
MAEPIDLSQLTPVSLAEVVAEAAALTRVDRKYVVPVEVAQQVVDRLGSHRVLTFGTRCWTTYRTVYFDTPDLAACRAHVQQRRRRWKARTRLYVEDRHCRVEVKARTGGAVTHKRFTDAPAEDFGRLGAAEARFIHAELTGLGFAPASRLAPAMEIGYRRATLADLTAGTRVTIDREMRASRAGVDVVLDRSHVLLETKGGLRPGEADLVLLSLGVRPRSFSKYAASVSLSEPGIADNDVRSMLGHELHVLSGGVW